MKKQYFVKEIAEGRYRVVTLKPGVDVREYVAKNAEKGTRVLRTSGAPPALGTMTRWSDDGVAKATDGCRIEPDGVCQHGHPSWLVALGYM